MRWNFKKSLDKRCFVYYCEGFKTLSKPSQNIFIMKLTMKYTCIYLTTALLLMTKGTNASHERWGSTGIASGSCLSAYSTETVEGVSGTCVWGRKLLWNVLVNSSFLKLINTFLILTHSCFTGICFHFQLEKNAILAPVKLIVYTASVPV